MDGQGPSRAQQLQRSHREGSGMRWCAGRRSLGGYPSPKKVNLFNYYGRIIIYTPQKAKGYLLSY